MTNKNPVEKNHFIPCYWSAYWNFEYLNAKRKNQLTNSPRHTKISYLNLKGNKILNGKTEKVFIDKCRGLAILETDNDFEKLKNNFIFHNNSDEISNQSDLLLLDFENHFTEYENISRSALERTILSKKIKDIEDKTFLAQFFMFQEIRNPFILNKRYDFLLKNGKNKVDLLLEVRDFFTNKKKLENILIPLVFSKWVVYSLEDYKFPLPDKPILYNKNNILVPLAPDILIEIQLDKKTENIASYKNKISFFKYLKFSNRLTKNVNMEVVGDDYLLNKLKKRKKRFANTV